MNKSHNLSKYPFLRATTNVLVKRHSYTFIEIIMTLLLIAGAGLIFATYMRAGVSDYKSPLAHLSTSYANQRVIERVLADYKQNYKGERLYELWDSINDSSKKGIYLSSDTDVQLSAKFLDSDLTEIEDSTIVENDPNAPFYSLKITVSSNNQILVTLLSIYF